MAAEPGFKSREGVRWCPGCGDYAILSAVLRLLPTLGIPREKFAFISGIGCSSRFPYYVETYGFHGIHGRAIPLATGLKCARPDLSVWVVTGDGDGLSIGGNHLLHALRRNPDIKVLLFNNRIYGLTKGQYSPTSELGKVTKSSPFGTIDRPLSPLSLALACDATFAARAVDNDGPGLNAILRRAAEHRGTALVEILQNCVVFNDGAFAAEEDKTRREDFLLRLEAGQPLVFGTARDRGLRWKDGRPEVVRFSGEPPADLILHDDKSSWEYAAMLARLAPPDFPTPVGLLRCATEPTLDGLMDRQLAEAGAAGPADFDRLLAGPLTWEVR